MAGLCNIDFSDEQISLVYTYAYKSLIAQKEANEEFSYKKIADKLYDALEAKYDNITAAAHLQLLPSQMMQVFIDVGIEALPEGFTTKLSRLGKLINNYTDVEAVLKSRQEPESQPITQEDLDSWNAAANDALLNQIPLEEDPYDEYNTELIEEQQSQARKKETTPAEKASRFQHKKRDLLASTGNQSIFNWLSGYSIHTLIKDPRVNHIYDFLTKFEKYIGRSEDPSEITFGGHTGFKLAAIKKSEFPNGQLNGQNIVHKRDLDYIEGKEKKSEKVNKLTEERLEEWKEYMYELYNSNKEAITKGVDPLVNGMPPSIEAIDKEYNRLKRQIGKTVWLISPVSKTEALKKYNKAIELFVTDNDGNILFFDENHNVVEQSAGGMPVYFPLAEVSKYKGGYKFSTDAQRKGAMTPEEQARYDIARKMSVYMPEGVIDSTVLDSLTKEYTEAQQKDLEIIYKIRRAAEKGFRPDVTISYIKDGVTSSNFLPTIKKPLLNTVNWDNSSVNASEVVHVAERDNDDLGERKGVGYLRLPGYAISTSLERRAFTKEEAETLADLIYNDELYIQTALEGKIKNIDKRIELFNNQVYTVHGQLQVHKSKKGDKADVKINGKINNSREDLVKKLTETYYNKEYEKYFPTQYAKANLPMYSQDKAASKEETIELFTIEGNEIKTYEVDRLKYILDNTETHVVLAKDKSIPKINGYISFELTLEQAEALDKAVASKKPRKKKTKPKAEVKVEEVEAVKENVEPETEKTLEELEEELEEVTKTLKELEESMTPEDAAEKGAEIATQLTLDFSQGVKEQVLENVTEKEVSDVAKEQGVTEEEAVEMIASGVEEQLQSGEDQDKPTKKDSKLKLIIKRIARIIRNGLIGLALYTGVTAYSFDKGTYHINNTVEATADIFFSNEYTVEYADTFILGMTKLGIYDPSVNEQTVDMSNISESKEVREFEVERNATQKQIEAAKKKYKQDNTYFEVIDKDWEDVHYKASKGDKLLMARNQWFNEDGFTYASGSIQSKLKPGETISGVEGVAHFMILDDLGVDLTTKTTDAELINASKDFQKNRIGHDIKMTDYVPVFYRDSNKVTVKYKIASEVTSEDITITRLHQYKFSDIDFSSKTSAKPFGFHGGGVYALTNKNGKGLPSFLFTDSGKGAYSRFSGGSYVLLFNDNQGNLIVHEISGSLNMLQKEGRDVAKNFNIPEESITLGIYDAGSYSAKPASDSQGILNTDQYKNYNKIHPHSGGSLLYPTETLSAVPETPLESSLPLAFMFLSPLALIKRKRALAREITPEDIQALREYKDELIQKINKIKAESGEAANPVEEISMSEDELSDFAEGLLDDLDKPKTGLLRRFRFDKLTPGHRKKAKQAMEEYKASPLNKLFPVELAMNVVNSNAYATWTKHGVTLHAGASFTDLYHESWHGFSQFFLTRDQKIALYNEVAETAAGKKALKQYAKANNRSVESITDLEGYWVMEELLAEDYRKYRLSNGRSVLKNRPQRNSIFRRIFNFLMELFGASKITDNPNTISNVRKLYEDLRLLKDEDLVKYNPNEINIIPGFKKLNRGIQPFKPDSAVRSSYSDDLAISESLDSIMSSEMGKLIDKYGQKISNGLYSKPEKLLPELYKRSFTVLKERLSEVEEKLQDENIESSEVAALEYQAKVLKFAVEQFGSKDDMLDALSGKTDLGVIPYHLKRSEYLKYVPKELDRESLEESMDLEGPRDSVFEKINADLSMKDLANPEIKALLHSARFYDDKGNLVMNKLGFPKMLPFNRTFGILIGITKGISDPVLMRDEMLKASTKLSNKWIKEDVLKRLGPIQTYNRSSFSIWTKFWQTFYKHEISFDQVTVQEIFEKLENGKVQKVVKHLHGSPAAAAKQAEFDFRNYFKIVSNHPFIERNEDGENILNVEKLVGKYGSNIKDSEKIEFLHDIGIPVTEEDRIIDIVNSSVNVNYLLDRLKEINDKTTAEITDVVEVLRKGVTYNTSGVLPGSTTKKTTASEATNIDTILDAEVRYSGNYPNVAVRNPEGNMQFEDNQNSSLTRRVQAFNDANSFDELIENPIMQHLNPRINDYANNTPIWLNSLFDMENTAEGRPKRKGVSIKISNVSGTQLTTDGEADFGFSTLTSNSDKYTRQMADIYGMLMGGRPSIPTPADKGTIYSIYIDNIEVPISDYGKKVSKHLYVDSVDFYRQSTLNPEITIGELTALSLMYGHIQAEIDFIKRVESGNNPNVVGLFTDKILGNAEELSQEEIDKLVSKKDVYLDKKTNLIKEKARGKNFQIFDGVFSTKTKKALLELEMPLKDYISQNTDESIKLRDAMIEEFGGFVETLTDELHQRNRGILAFDSTIIADFDAMMSKKKIDQSERKKAILAEYDRQAKAKEITYKELELKKKRVNSRLRNEKEVALLKSYVTNLFIHNIETFGSVFGNLAEYKDFFKRMPGLNSDGYQFRNDAWAREYINNKMFSNEGIKSTYAYSLFGNKLPKRSYDGTIGTAIFQETVIESAMINDLRASFKEHYEEVYKPKLDAGILSEDEYVKTVDDAVALSIYPYTNMEEGDGQGWITIDAYRMLAELQGKWGPEQQELYDKIISGEEITIGQYNKYFPVRKYQYYGNLVLKNGAAQAFHKYSLAPLVPNVIGNKNMQTLHENMIKQGIDYGVHESGSKLATVYAKDSQTADVLYSNVEDRIIPEAPIYDGTQETRFYTPNILNVEYLKDQLDINDKFKKKSIFSTQLRKLIQDGSMENGVPLDFRTDIVDKDKRKLAWNKLTPQQKIEESPFWVRVLRYESNLETFIERRKSELLEKAGWTQEEFNSGTGNMKSLIELVRKELEDQDVGDHEVSYIDTNIDGNKILRDLSMSPSAEKIERSLISLINNQLVRQKVNGEALVQLAATGMELKAATEEQTAIYGDEDLKYYRRSYDENGNKSLTLGAEVKITLQGEFKKLMWMKHKDGNVIAVKDENGKILETETLKRLNETINDQEWISKPENRMMITITGVRIPVQGYNSMEFFVVREFLPESAGNVIVPPREIVAKSGGDFDIDKLTMLMPRLIRVGDNIELLRDSKSKRTKEEIKKEIDSNRDLKDSINDDYKAKIKEARKDASKPLYKALSTHFDAISNLQQKMYQSRKMYGKYYKLINSDKINTFHYNQMLEKHYLEWEYYESEIANIEDNLTNEKAKIWELIKEDPEVLKVFEERNAEIKEVDLKIDKLYKELEGTKSTAIENELIIDIIDFLSEPANYISLITPNDTSLVKGKANQMKEVLNNRPGAYNPLKSFKKKKGGELNLHQDEKGNVYESPTRALTPVHNNYVHENNAVGKAALGLGAVDNTFNILLNRAGAHMNPFYGLEIPTKEVNGKKVPLYGSIMQYEAALNEELSNLEKKKKKTQEEQIRIAEIENILAGRSRIKLFLPHNTLKYEGRDVISLSHVYDQAGNNKIADIINQLMNGWVDVAKDNWIFNVQGTKIISPALLFLVQAGVPFNTAVDFLSNPLIGEYVNEQLKIQSPFASILDQRASNKLEVKNKAKENVLKRNYPNLFSNKKSLKKAALDEITLSAVNSNTAENLFSEESLEKIYRGENSEMMLASFLHFLEIEEYAKGLRDIKLTLNFDTSKSSTLFDASAAIAGYNELLEKTLFPRHIIEKVAEDSPIGAFNNNEFILKLWAPLFPVRAHAALNDYITKAISDKNSKTKMETLYGKKDRYVNAFRNGLPIYAFLEEFSRFDINKLKNYKGLETSFLKEGISEVTLLDRGVGVVEKDGKPVLYIDKKTLEDQFASQSYSPNPMALKAILGRKYQENKHYSKLGLAELSPSLFNGIHGPNKNDYFRFVIERELLRYNNPLSEVVKTKEFMWSYKDKYETLPVQTVTFKNDKGEIISKEETIKERQSRIVKKAYEEWLRDKALTNTLNLNHLFKSPSASVAHIYKNIKIQNPHLEKIYTVIEDMIPDAGQGYFNIKLRDHKLNKDMINVYHQEILQLADPNVMKVLGNTEQDILENERISKFFQMLPLYSMLQSGLNATDRLSMGRVMPYEVIHAFFEESNKNLIKTLSDPATAFEYLSDYEYTFDTFSSNKTTRRRAQNLKPKYKAPKAEPVTQPKAGVNLGNETTPDVILPIGTSGSGKSTFIKSLPQKNLVVIEPDAMRVEFTGDINDKSKDKEIYKEAAKRAVAAIKQGKQVVFDTTNLTKEKRRPFIETIKKAIPTANIQYKLMPLDPELAKQRIKEQLARGENRAAVSDETIDRHAASYAQMLEDIKSEGMTEYQNALSKFTGQSVLQSEELEITELLTNGLINTKGLTKLNVKDAEVFTKQIFNKTQSQSIFNKIEDLYDESYDLQHKASDKFGKVRRSMYFSDVPYTYSGVTRPANLGNKFLQNLIANITEKLGFEPGYFDMILINEYKDGSQKIGFHTDNEPILNNKGKLNPSVVTVSFGDERTMVLKDNTGKETEIAMPSGLGLIMGKNGQTNYKHGIKSEANKTKRFSITLRHNAQKSQAVDKVLPNVKKGDKKVGLTSTQEKSVYTFNPKTKNEFDEIVRNNPDVFFVLEKADTQETNALYHPTLGKIDYQDNLLGITTRKLLSNDNKAHFSDANVVAFREKVDAEIAIIKEILDGDGKVAFIKDGYATYMLGEKGGDYIGERSYDHLSKNLFENFQYINKNSRYLQQSGQAIQAVQEITDVELQNNMDLEVESILSILDNCG